MKNQLLLVSMLMLLLTACQNKPSNPKNEVDLVYQKKDSTVEDDKTKNSIDFSKLNLPEKARKFLEQEQNKDTIIFEITNEKFILNLEEVIDIIYNFPKITEENAPSYTEVIDYSNTKRSFGNYESPSIYIVYAYIQYNINDLSKQQKEMTTTYIEMDELALDLAYAQLITGSFGYEHSISSFGKAIQWVLHESDKEQIGINNYTMQHAEYMELMKKRAWLNFEDRLPFEYMDKDKEKKKRKDLNETLARINTKVNTPLKLQILKEVNFSIDYNYMKKFGVFDEE